MVAAGGQVSALERLSTGTAPQPVHHSPQPRVVTVTHRNEKHCEKTQFTKTHSFYFVWEKMLSVQLLSILYEKLPIKSGQYDAQ